MLRTPGQHIPASTAHAGQRHHDKNELEQAAKAIDQGPSFGTPGDPPDADPDSIEEIEQAYETPERVVRRKD